MLAKVGCSSNYYFYIQERYADVQKFQDFGPPSAPPIAARGGEVDGIFDAIGESNDHFLLQTFFFVFPFAGKDN